MVFFDGLNQWFKPANPGRNVFGESGALISEKIGFALSQGLKVGSHFSILFTKLFINPMPSSARRLALLSLKA